MITGQLPPGIQRYPTPPAIVRRSGSDCGIAACGQKSNPSAHAESDRAKRRLNFLEGLQVVYRRAHVGDYLIVLDRTHQSERARQIVVSDDVVRQAKIKACRYRDEPFWCGLIR